MKRALPLIYVFTFFLTSTLFGQTTLEEYKYVTKGYQVQIESGLDMKKGYSVEDVDFQSTEERTASLKALKRIKPDGTKKIAAYLIVYTRSDLPTEYICVPHPDSDQDILMQYFDQLYNGSGDSSRRLQLIAYIISMNVNW